MKFLTDRFVSATALLTVAWAALFVRQYLHAGWLEWLPVWVPALAALAAMGAAYPRLRTANPQLRAAVAGAGLSITIAGLLLFTVKDNSAGLEEEWRRSESRQITTVLGAVGERIDRLLALSTEVGERTKAFMRSEGLAEDESM